MSKVYREIELTDEKLVKLLEERGKLNLEKFVPILEELERVENERNKIAMQLQKNKDKTMAAYQKVIGPLRTEYEVIEKVELKDGKIVATLYDAIEEYKLAFKEKNK